MDLEELQQHWNEFGRTDALRAILVNHPLCVAGRWDPERFFETGRREIDWLMSQSERLQAPARRERALDFGCGVGRLTQALCSWFERSCGVDIAPSMIELAGAYNQFGARCQYRLNSTNDLRQFPDQEFDLVYSNIVLQHMEPRYSTAYIREFVRVLRPGGLLAFQLPEQWKAAVPRSGGTRDTGPLPRGAYRAVLSGYPSRVSGAANTSMQISVKVRNGGTCTWPSIASADNKYAINLANHWLTPDGKVAIWDDGRQFLPCDVAPGAEVEMNLGVTTPPRPGSYILQLDLVHENVAWFSQRGSQVAVVSADVQPSDSSPHQEPAADAALPASGADPEFTPRMEVYGVERAEAIQILTGAGGRLLEVLEDGSAGPQWTSFCYFATK
jgi:SAM-dependent methyltransferase